MSWPGKNISLLKERDFSDSGKIIHPDLKKGLCTVMFYADWCGHCAATKPVYKEVADKLRFQKDVNLAGVDCTNKTVISDRLNKVLSDKGFEVKGYPTITQFKNGEYSKTLNGARDGLGLLEFAVNS